MKEELPYSQMTDARLLADRDMEYVHLKDQRGKYQSGIATVQCMYAPEFGSHSESFEIEATD